MAQTRCDGLSAADAARLVDGFERSNLTRREFCEEVGIPVTTLDYYRRRESERRQAELVPVRIVNEARTHDFTLVLANGRRIEGHWDFSDDRISRLVRLVEQA